MSPDAARAASDGLHARVRRANLRLVSEGLVRLTWGNASGFDRDRQVVLIKPSGVPYDDRLRETDLVEVGLEGQVAPGQLRPSTDTPDPPRPLPGARRARWCRPHPLPLCECLRPGTPPRPHPRDDPRRPLPG